MKRCTNCKSRHRQPRNLCKKCHASAEKIRRSKRSEDEKSENKIYFQKLYSLKCIRLLNGSNDDKIQHWATNWKRRRGPRFVGRSLVPMEVLKGLAKRAIVDYPYIVFYGPCRNADRASVDRTDPGLDYSHVENLRVIPYWINSAKCDLLDNEFRIRIVELANSYG